MNKKFDIAIIGNGLLGSTLSVTLAELGYNICIIGAKYGHKNEFYSSHQDETRIVRTFHHNNHYWENLAIKSFPNLMKISLENPEVFKPAPVKYLLNEKKLHHNPYLIKNDSSYYNYIDAFGGILNPILYIELMNRKLIDMNGGLILDAVDSILYDDSHYISSGDFGKVESDWVIDVRGIHGVEKNNKNEFIIGKVAMFFSLIEQDLPCFAFIDEITSSELIHDFYGICHYRDQSGLLKSKISFTEANPIILDKKSIVNWFNSGFKKHPLLKDALELVFSKFPNFKLDQIKPCAFVKSINGKPNITLEHQYLRINACNGMLAKSAIAFSQELANKYFHR